MTRKGEIVLGISLMVLGALGWVFLLLIAGII